MAFTSPVPSLLAEDSTTSHEQHRVKISTANANLLFWYLEWHDVTELAAIPGQRARFLFQTPAIFLIFPQKWSRDSNAVLTANASCKNKLLKTSDRRQICQSAKDLSTCLVWEVLPSIVCNYSLGSQMRAGFCKAELFCKSSHLCYHPLT